MQNELERVTLAAAATGFRYNVMYIWGHQFSKNAKTVLLKLGTGFEKCARCFELTKS